MPIPFLPLNPAAGAAAGNLLFEGSRSTDFRSPVMSATIITNPGADPANARRTPLWMRPAGLDSSDGGLTDMPFLTELVVELNLGYLPKITASLTPPFEQGIKFLNGPLIEWGRSVLEVQFGYSTGPNGPVLSVPYSGILLKPSVSIGEDVSITLNAQGLGGFSAVRQGGPGEFSGESRLDIIKKVAAGPDKKNPRMLKVDASDVTPSSGEAYKLLIQDKSFTESQAFLTDWTFIWKLVRAAKCWMALTGDSCQTLRIFPRDLAMNKTPKYVLRLHDFPGGKIGMSSGVFPILSFDSPTMAVYLPGASRGIFVQGINPENKKIFSDLMDESNAAPQRLGPKDGAAAPAATRQMPGADSKTGAGAQYMVGSDDPNVAREQAGAEYQALSAASMGIPATVGTIGIPDSLPGDVMAVRGVGERLEGNYGVFKVTHTINSDGYATSLELRSNLSPASLSPPSAETEPQRTVNDRPPNEKGDDRISVRAKKG